MTYLAHLASHQIDTPTLVATVQKRKMDKVIRNVRQIEERFSAFQAGDDPKVGQLDPRLAERQRQEVHAERANEAAVESICRDLDAEDNAFNMDSQYGDDPEKKSTHNFSLSTRNNRRLQCSRWFSVARLFWRPAGLLGRLW